MSALYYIFPPCIYVFPVTPTINSDYFPTQHSSTGLCNGVSMRSRKLET